MKSSFTLLLSSILTLTLFFSCTEPEEELNKVNLPYIGHHDVVHVETEDYNVGDTAYHTVPRWNYLTQDSTFLKSDDIDDKIWIVDFIFTHCPTICPPMTKAMRGLNDSLKGYKNDLRFLSFSIDPDRDTPARLRLYRKRHDISADNWFFLTGNEAETHALGIDGFQLLANADEKAPGGFAHSPNFVLIDKDQRIRGVYDGLDAEGRKQLIKDAKLLLNAK